MWPVITICYVIVAWCSANKRCVGNPLFTSLTGCHAQLVVLHGASKSVLRYWSHGPRFVRPTPKYSSQAYTPGFVATTL